MVVHASDASIALAAVVRSWRLYALTVLTPLQKFLTNQFNFIDVKRAHRPNLNNILPSLFWKGNHALKPRSSASALSSWALSEHMKLPLILCLDQDWTEIILAKLALDFLNIEILAHLQCLGVHVFHLVLFFCFIGICIARRHRLHHMTSNVDTLRHFHWLVVEILLY